MCPLQPGSRPPRDSPTGGQGPKLAKSRLRSPTTPAVEVKGDFGGGHGGVGGQHPDASVSSSCPPAPCPPTGDPADIFTGETRATSLPIPLRRGAPSSPLAPRPPRVSLLLLLVLVRFTPQPRAKAGRELEDRPRSASCVDLGHLEIPGIAKLLSEVKPSRDAFQLFLRASWRHRAGGRSQRTERDLAAGAASAACGACNGVAGVPSPPECQRHTVRAGSATCLKTTHRTRQRGRGQAPTGPERT